MFGGGFLTEVVGIKFKKVGKTYYFSPDRLKFKIGDRVIVKTARGIEMGEVVMENKMVEDSTVIAPLKKVLRLATEKDVETSEKNRAREKETMDICEQVIAEHGLEMKLVDVEYTFDGNKLLFYFTAEGRVDFRELVKALASEFKLRIELRQIGPREGSKMIGGIGSCGRELCCKKHIREFDLVTMKMAKEQGMALSSSKIAGVCGKLMCCIGYESKVYEDVRKRVPGVGDIVKTPTCEKCKVISADFLREIIKTENNGTIEEWTAKEVVKIKSNKQKDEKLAADVMNLED